MADPMSEAAREYLRRREVGEGPPYLKIDARWWHFHQRNDAELVGALADLVRDVEVGQPGLALRNAHMVLDLIRRTPPEPRVEMPDEARRLREVGMADVVRLVIAFFVGSGVVGVLTGLTLWWSADVRGPTLLSWLMMTWIVSFSFGVLVAVAASLILLLLERLTKKTPDEASASSGGQS